MAKKIINGRMYNTDTTEVLGSWDNGYPRGDFSFEEQTLHKKKTGEYFVYASGGAQSNFGDCYGGHDCSGEKFIPMSVEQAQQWSEEYKNIVHINTKAKRSQTSCLQEVWPFYSLTSVKDGIISY